MNDIQREILNDIKNLEIDCPDCHYKIIRHGKYTGKE